MDNFVYVVLDNQCRLNKLKGNKRKAKKRYEKYLELRKTLEHRVVKMRQK